MTPKAHHPALVVLHWLVAALVVGALLGGFTQLDRTPNTDPAKIGSLRIHMGIGLTILVLMVLRVIVRLRTTPPAPFPTGVPALETVAKVTHAGIYLALFGMAFSGIALSQAAGLPAVVFGGEGMLPADFHVYTARRVHGALAMVLAGLVALHVVAAFWHAGVRGDGIMARMGFGPR